MTDVIPFRNVVPLEQRIGRINDLWRGLSSNYVEGIIKIGEELKAAQEEHDDEEKSQQELAQRLPFSQAWISRFIAIAQNPVMRNAHNRIYFPPDYTLIAMLNQLTEKKLLAEIKAGHVRVDMTRKEAKALLPPKRERRSKQTSARSLVLEIIKKNRRGLTADDVHIKLPKINPQTVKAAVDALKQEGFLKDTGKRKKTRAGGGRKAIVYKYQKIPEMSIDDWSDKAAVEHDANPKNLYASFCLRMGEVVRYVNAGYSGQVTLNVVKVARRTMEACGAMVKKLEERYQQEHDK